MKKSEKAIEAFERELKFGQNPSIRDYNRKYGGLDDDTLRMMLILWALYEKRKDPVFVRFAQRRVKELFKEIKAKQKARKS